MVLVKPPIDGGVELWPSRPYALRIFLEMPLELVDRRRYEETLLRWPSMIVSDDGKIVWLLTLYPFSIHYNVNNIVVGSFDDPSVVEGTEWIERITAEEQRILRLKVVVPIKIDNAAQITL